MKSTNYINRCLLQLAGLGMFLGASFMAAAQNTDSTLAEAAPPVTTVKTVKPVKNTFGSIWLIDNQTVMVPIRKTFEMDIMHRFGKMGNGYKDFYGLFASSNIRLGFDYVPINNLMVGLSLTKQNMSLEGYAKYALIRQTKGKYPVSISYYVNAALDTRPDAEFYHNSDKWMFFHQVLIARKITDRLSLQVAPSLTHVNFVEGYYKAQKTESGADTNVLAGVRNHDHFALACMGRFKLTTNMALIVNYDQPLTKHLTGNPSPNIALGLEVSTSAHAFQFFMGNYSYITPSRNNYFNQNYYEPYPWQGGTQFLIGFNITRLWNY